MCIEGHRAGRWGGWSESVCIERHRAFLFMGISVAPYKVFFMGRGGRAGGGCAGHKFDDKGGLKFRYGATRVVVEAGSADCSN